VVAVDGKTVRRSGSRRHDHGPLHLVSAWASDQGLVPGFTHELDGPLTTGRAGRSPMEAIGDGRHDRRFDGVLCWA
jgi:hypothetical protein